MIGKIFNMTCSCHNSLGIMKLYIKDKFKYQGDNNL